MIEVLKQALEALESCGEGHITDGGNQWHDAKLVDTATTSLRQAIAELESQYPHGMYGAEDLDKAWKSGYDNCKDQYAYLDKQEPVAWMREDATLRFADGKMFAVGQPFYTHPPQRTWVGLADEEIWQIATDSTIGGDLHADKFAKAIKAKLKERNEHSI